MTRMAPPAPRPRGTTLIELMVSMVVASIMLGSTVALFRSQHQSFLNGAEKLDGLQNARFAVSQVERILRTMGAGVGGQQPMLAYGADSVVAFNADYVENDTTDFRWAVNFNPSTPGEATAAWAVENRQNLPNTSFPYPPLTFRQANGARSPAETITFFLTPDNTTARPDDWLLMQQVNQLAPELVARSILAYPGRPFFEYLLARRLPTGADTAFFAGAALLPLIRRVPDASYSSTDSANALRPDSVRAVRLNLRLTNGKIGVEERLRDVSTLVGVPNNGLPQVSVCGRSPFAPTVAAATPDASPGSGRILLSWTPSPDQSAGETDVWQYVIYVRPRGSATWDDPVFNMRRLDTATVYSVALGGFTPDSTYEFAVAAQDCTPLQSTLTTASAVAP